MGEKSPPYRSDAGQVKVGATLAIGAAALSACLLGLAAAGAGALLPAANTGGDDSTMVNGQGWTVPAKGQVTSTFRPPQRPNHAGTDIANSPGTPIWAASTGTVTQAECTSTTCARPESGDGCGWTVRIQHAGDIATRYCHLRDRPTVTVGQYVKGGEQIGLMGSTGDSTGPHLHFECYTAGRPVNCQPFLSARGVQL